MSYSMEQIEKGNLRQYIGRDERKYKKKFHHKRLRRKYKSNNDFVPQYNRYAGWSV